ncbi:response regulator transcription factor [Cohnella herbarum]|nr:response regulator transcription factor [Cohnella herbarum]QJD84711.1 response regulator transcription factor [Cohnella herbarum]
MAEHRPQSALCMPVAIHGSAVGVLYLENYAAASFVSEDRIHILHAMASQGVYICELLRSLSGMDGGSDISEELDAEKSGDKTPAAMEEPLTDREMEVLALLAAGLSNKEIAERLFVAVGTVKVHVKNIFTKLKVNRRTKAIAQAKELHLLD